MKKIYVNKITIEKDGVYVSYHKTSDFKPYRSVKINYLTNIYIKDGQKGLDREILSAMFEVADLRGDHPSIKRYLYAYNSEYKINLYKELADKLHYYYVNLNENDKAKLLSHDDMEIVNYFAHKKYLESVMCDKLTIKCDEYDLINKMIEENKDDKSFSYYEKIINNIIEVSDDYDVKFHRDCPFDGFGSDEESKKFGMYSFSEFFKEILEKNNIEIEDISTREKSAGKYIVTIDNNHEFEINAWEKLDNVFDDVESMINVIKDKNLEI